MTGLYLLTGFSCDCHLFVQARRVEQYGPA